MKRSRFAEEQIIAVLREHEAGAKTGDLARKHGISEATLYNWKAKYGGVDVSDAKRLKALEVWRFLREQRIDLDASKSRCERATTPSLPRRQQRDRRPLSGGARERHRAVHQ
jgi:transposase-like protein